MSRTIQHARRLESRHRGRATSDGAGVRLTRVLDQPLQKRLDPFLLLDEFSSDDPNDYIAGFPDHPHRGFETVTYMLAGAMLHEDSVGNRGELIAGSVQWMTAGRGIIHSEMPRQENGLMRGFQLWVNLPAEHKMDPPRYQDIPPEQVPEITPAAGVRIKVITGQTHGVDGAARDIVTQPVYLDIELQPGAELQQAIPAGHTAFVYVYEGGAVRVGDETLQQGELGILDQNPAADGVILTAAEQSARLLLLAGRPIGEPIVQWGPFVMNRPEEIEQAMQDYRDGRLAV